MAIAKVVYKENASATPEVWMDTTQKTVTAGTMLSGTTALKNDGTGITGNIASKSSSDLTASGGTVTAPAGYYAEAASKSVASGSAGTPTATKGTVSNHSISVTPSVTNTTGYITGSTINGTAVTVDVTELESGTKSITSNGTGISVSGYSAVNVSVSSGSSWNLLTSDEFTVSTTSTSATAVGTIDLSAYIPSFNKGDILWFHIRDKAGPRNGYFYGSDCFFVSIEDGNVPSVGNPPCYGFRYDSDAYGQSTGAYGVYCYKVSTAQHIATINAKYNSTNSLTIDGTFKVDVYKLNADPGMTMLP